MPEKITKNVANEVPEFSIHYFDGVYYPRHRKLYISNYLLSYNDRFASCGCFTKWGALRRIKKYFKAINKPKPTEYIIPVSVS